METLPKSNFKLGMIAGGQLGKMLTLAASTWDLKTYVLDTSENCPAACVCTGFVNGSPLNFDDVYRFGQTVDLLTFEVENVNIDALVKLESEGKQIFPQPRVLALIKDKGTQKSFFREAAIPTSSFELYENAESVHVALQNGKLTFPFVQKLRTSGYDGKGVAVINSSADLHKLLEGSCVVESKIAIAQELAVQVARNAAGETAVFPVVDLEFNSEANLVEFLSCPSTLSESIQDQAKELALHIITKLEMVGLLAVEFFLATDGKLYVNEISPRAHNSGHHTIESCITSQYEQQLRSVMGFSLGSTELKVPSVMVNLLGAQGCDGPPVYHGIDECMSIAGTKIHIYGKSRTKPFRKMGHATVLDKSLDIAKEKAKKVRDLIKITA